MSKTTRRSLWFAACILIGLLFAFIEGVEPVAIARTALIFFALFVVYLCGEALHTRLRKP